MCIVAVEVRAKQTIVRWTFSYGESSRAVFDVTFGFMLCFGASHAHPFGLHPRRFCGLTCLRSMAILHREVDFMTEVAGSIPLRNCLQCSGLICGQASSTPSYANKNACSFGRFPFLRDPRQMQCFVLNFREPIPVETTEHRDYFSFLCSRLADHVLPPGIVSPCFRGAVIIY